jgi:hypothetical protein
MEMLANMTGQVSASITDRKPKSTGKDLFQTVRID